VIEQVGTPMDLYSRPETTFVAGFIGSPAMNMLPADFMREKVEADGLAHVPSKADLIGIRPEDFSTDQPGEGDLQLSGQLLLLEPAGAESHLHMRFEGFDRNVVVRLGQVPDVAEGQEMTFSIKRSALHPFDLESGQRVA